MAHTREHRRFRDRPSFAAVASSWRLFRARRRGDRPRYAWRMAQSQAPVFLVALAVLAGNAAGAVLGVFGAMAEILAPVAPHTGAPPQAVGAVLAAPLVAGLVLLFVAAICLVGAALAYPLAQYQYATVLWRFGGAARAEGRGLRLGATVLLLLTDVLFVLALGSPLAVAAWVLLMELSGWILIAWVAAWPFVMAGVLLFRLHFREALIVERGALGRAVGGTFWLITRHIFDTLLGTMLQTLYLAALLAWASVACIPGLIVAGLIALVLGGLHALAWWGVGYEGAGHVYAACVEVPLLLLLFLMMTGYLTAPVALLASLHRLEYVRMLLGKRSDVLPIQPPEAPEPAPHAEAPAQGHSGDTTPNPPAS